MGLCPISKACPKKTSTGTLENMELGQRLKLQILRKNLYQVLIKNFKKLYSIVGAGFLIDVLPSKECIPISFMFVVYYNI